jgi:hypothetical protein
MFLSEALVWAMDSTNVTYDCIDILKEVLTTDVLPSRSTLNEARKGLQDCSDEFMPTQLSHPDGEGGCLPVYNCVLPDKHMKNQVYI